MVRLSALALDQEYETKWKQFNYTLVTDGISVSVEYKNFNEKPLPKTYAEEMEEQAKTYKKFGQQYNAGQYDIAAGVDLGYKLYIACVVKDLRSGHERAIKIPSNQYYSMTNQHRRDKIAKRLTVEFEDKADRENTDIYSDYPSPQKQHYMEYIQHRFKLLREAISDIYGTDKYTRLSLDQYICSQKAMDQIVHTLTDGVESGRMLLCVGSTNFAANSPIKKYRRCPVIRKLNLNDNYKRNHKHTCKGHSLHNKYTTTKNY